MVEGSSRGAWWRDYSPPAPTKSTDQKIPRCWRRSASRCRNSAAAPSTTTRPPLRITMSSATVEHQLGVLLDEHDRQPLLLEPADRRHDLRHDLRAPAPPRARPSGARRGFDIRARPIASICCSPPESEPATCRRRSRRRGKSAQTESSVHAVAAPARGLRPATTRFSRTVRLRKIRRPCGTRATPCAAIASGARPVTSRPKTATRPRAGRQQPDGHAHRGGLARAVAAEQPEEAALAEPERHAVQDVAVAVEGVDVVEHQRAHSPR